MRTCLIVGLLTISANPSGLGAAEGTNRRGWKAWPGARRANALELRKRIADEYNAPNAAAAAPTRWPGRQVGALPEIGRH
jgi:hypothetical protein